MENLEERLRDAFAVIDSYAEQMAIMNNGNVRRGADHRKQVAQLEARIRELDAQLSKVQTVGAE